MTATLAAERTYQPYGAALAMMTCMDRVVLMDGPVRTGKTIAILTKAYILGEEFPGIRVLFLRETRESLTETVLQTWEDEVVPAGHPMLTAVTRNNRQAYHHPNGTEFVCGGLDNPAKIMSGQYDLILIFEATQISAEAFGHLTTRNVRFHMPFNQILMDCNPDFPLHWIKQAFERGDITRFQAKFQDNPKYWDMERDDWTEQGRALIESLDRLPPMLRARFKDGLWVAAEGAVYDCFDAERDVIDGIDIPPGWPRYIGLDFGGANTAALFYALDPDTDQLFLYREYHAGGRTAGQHAHYLRLHEPDDLFVVGGAQSEGQWRDEFAAAGLLVREPLIRDVALGIQRVYGQHKRGNIKVFRSCTGYLAQKSDYRYKKDSAIPGEIEKKHTYHFMDAERYIVGYLRPELSLRAHSGPGRRGVARATEQ